VPFALKSNLANLKTKKPSNDNSSEGFNFFGNKSSFSSSRRLTFGGVCPKLQELDGLTVSQTYSLAWEQQKRYLDLTELARLRWDEGWNIEQLADYFQISLAAVKQRLRVVREKPNRAGLASRPTFPKVGPD
jgi:hypothetical protein